MKILSSLEVRKKVGGEEAPVARNTISNWVETQDFPPPIQIGPNRLGWSDEEVDAWLAARRRGFLAPVTDRHEAAA